jgi:hypothetical protein
MTRWPPTSTPNLRPDPDDLANSLQAAAASAASFTVGSLLPLPAIWLPPATFRLPIIVVAVLIALELGGALSARIGGSHVGRAVLRVVIGAPDDYRQLVPVVRCLPQASTVDDPPGLGSSLVTATG